MKWRYLILMEDCEFLGTNSLDIAKAQTEWTQVYDVEEGKRLEPSAGFFGGSSYDPSIKEFAGGDK